MFIEDYKMTDKICTIAIPCEGTETSQKKGCPKTTEREKEETMITLGNTALDVNQVSYFTERLRQIRQEKRDEAQVKFGLTSQYPKTMTEAFQRIAEGKVKIRDDCEDYGVSMSYVDWKDPSVKKDRAGFNAWEKGMAAAYYTAKDAIVATPAEGPKQIASFQSWTA